MGRRRGKNKNKKPPVEASEVLVMQGDGGSTSRSSSSQKDGGLKGCENAIEVAKCTDIEGSIIHGESKHGVKLDDTVNKHNDTVGKHDDTADKHDDIVDDTSYIPGLPEEVALRCLAFLPWMHHWKLGVLSRRHRDLIRHSRLFPLRQELQTFEQWICIYTSANNGWIAFDPKHRTWRNLPHALVGPNFVMSDKESLSAGTHLIWLGRDAFEFACYRYDLASDGWEKGPPMVNSRCLFASATSGKFAFAAGGITVCGLQFDVLNTAERYDSSKGVWEPLPHMATPRYKCSGFFMDGKFYVIGGKTMNHEPLMSGEEFDPVKNIWRTIENMYCMLDVSGPAPLVAVAGNELYAIESTSNLLKVYEKKSKTWKVLGKVPVRADFCDGWGLAFKSLGNELFVIGGHRNSTQNSEGVAVFSWRPTPGATSPDWQLVNLRVAGIGSFLFNCAVMAC
ncbi:hypothetical protein L7F22_060953 [Adiantum nelumboides]|nr:hypothetical protein [Adiantum nelumboides]